MYRLPLRRDKRPIRWNVLIYMATIHIMGLVALPFFSWANLYALLVLYFLTACIGVTLGFHRMASHKSFKAPKWLERILMTFGGLAAQGGPLEWVGLHRHHHLYSDTSIDHHDSHRGFWWSHFRWMIHTVPAQRMIPQFTKDLAKDPYYVWMEKNFLLLQVPVGAILFIIGGWSMVLWGIFLRLAVVYNVTWFVNSATHKWGYRRFNTDDNSRNNWWVALLTFGEGWHNNHHSVQSRARHGLTWWEVDVTWYIILILEQMGLATMVRV